MTTPARYENGVFRPLESVKIKEGTVVEVRVPTEECTSGERRPIRDLPFFGTWKDCEDISDGVEYVNRLRDNPRG
jgi:predicted DNA-binding antitoxin AbrB/MazE fold protein